MDDSLDKYYDEDSIPTFNKEVDYLALLQDVTTLEVDENGEIIPTWISAEDFANLSDLEIEQVLELAKENNYIIYLAKILGEELPADLYIICAPGCEEQLIKDDYKEYYELDIELELVEDDKKEQEEIINKDKILEAFSISQDVYNEIKDDLFSPANRYNPISDIKNTKERPKVIGWLVANIKSIIVTIPKDLKNIFNKRFKYKGPGLVLVDLEPGSSEAQQYNQDKFRNSIVIELKTTENCPKELSNLIKQDKQNNNIFINHLGLVKILIDEYGFTFGEMTDEAAEALRQQLFETRYKSIEMRKKFNEGYYSSPIDRANADLKVEYKIDVVNKGEHAASVDEWLQNHVTNITIRVPSAVEKTFVALYTDEVKYSVIDSTAKTSGGNPMIYGVSATVFVDTLEGLPQILWGIFDNKREVHNTNFALSLIRDYGPRFYEKNSKRSKKDANEAFIVENISIIDTFEEDSIEHSEFEKYTKLSEDSKAFETVNKIIEMTHSHKINLQIDYVAKVEGLTDEGDERIWGITKLYGGLNGPGDWLVYFDELEKLFEELDCWLISLVNDPVDDVFTLKVGFNFTEEITEGNELRKRARKHKKTDKKGARGWFVNPNAGNVEHNIAFFNKTMGVNTATSGDTGGIGEDYKYSSRELISAVMDAYGYTKQEAEKYIKTLSNKSKEFLVKGFKQDAKKNFYEQQELTEIYPNEGESKVDFVARFMKEMEDEHENPKQRYAVALSYWEKKK